MTKMLQVFVAVVMLFGNAGVSVVMGGESRAEKREALFVKRLKAFGAGACHAGHQCAVRKALLQYGCRPSVEEVLARPLGYLPSDNFAVPGASFFGDSTGDLVAFVLEHDAPSVPGSEAQRRLAELVRALLAEMGESDRPAPSSRIQFVNDQQAVDDDAPPVRSRPSQSRDGAGQQQSTGTPMTGVISPYYYRTAISYSYWVSRRRLIWYRLPTYRYRTYTTHYYVYR